MQAYRRLTLKIKTKFKINILCTDGNFAYKKIRISNKDVINKSETCLVESKNSIIRRLLARFHGKTSCYSKAIDMVSASLLLLFNAKITLFYNWLGGPKINPAKLTLASA